jgi:monofunctional glycosyltransferase
MARIKRKSTGGARRFVKRTLIALVLLPFAYLGVYMVYPDVGALRDGNPGKTSFMKYRELEWEKAGKTRSISQTWVPLSRISKSLILAVTISEDDKFWEHEGFDIEALHDAAVKDIKQKKLRYGGSTISQQLAKNLYLSPRKSIVRKGTEVILTWRIEHTLSKTRILELYLNEIEWGDGIFGIEAASRAYYHLPASALSPEQAARLAAVLPNPRKYRPNGDSRYIERRAQHILSIMARRGIIEGFDDVLGGESPKEPSEGTKADSTGVVRGENAPSQQKQKSDSISVGPKGR